MGFPSVSYTFSSSTTIVSGQVNQNFTDLVNGLSDGTKNISISALTCASTATFNGSINLGDSSADTLQITASLASSVPIGTNTSYDIGTSTLGLRSVYIGGSSTYTVRLIGGTQAASYSLTLPIAVPAASRYRVESDSSGVLSFQPKRYTGSDATNIGISATVAASALTVALKTAAGSDASSSDPIDIQFKNATITTGTPVTRTVTAAASVVIPSGTTIGTVSGLQTNIFVYAIDNSGTVELALSLSNLWDEGQVLTTTAISGGSSATNIYSTSSRSVVPIRLIGRIQISEATAGTWGTAPVEVSLLPIRSGKQLVAGTAQTSSSTTLSASLATLANSPTVTFSAIRSGFYEVFCTFILFNASNSGSMVAKVVGTSGSPTVISSPILIEDNSTANNRLTFYLKGVFQLVSNTSYTFALQVANNGGTSTTLDNADLTGGSILIAKEI